MARCENRSVVPEPDRRGASCSALSEAALVFWLCTVEGRAGHLDPTAVRELMTAPTTSISGRLDRPPRHRHPQADGSVALGQGPDVLGAALREQGTH